jgi:hypothetical protein
MFLLSQLSAIHHYIADVTISLTSLYVARAGVIVSLREMTGGGDRTRTYDSADMSFGK